MRLLQKCDQMGRWICGATQRLGLNIQMFLARRQKIHISQENNGFADVTFQPARLGGKDCALEVQH